MSLLLLIWLIFFFMTFLVITGIEVWAGDIIGGIFVGVILGIVFATMITIIMWIIL